MQRSDFEGIFEAMDGFGVTIRLLDPPLHEFVPHQLATQKELAEHMGWTPQNLSGRLKNNSLTFDELSKALHFAGYEVSMSDANGAGLPELGNSTSPAVAQTVDGVRYDTRKAESLCSNKAVMFEDFYVELFEDAAGNYFTVLYQLSGCQHHTITPVSPYIAKQFWERFSRKVV